MKEETTGSDQKEASKVLTLAEQEILIVEEVQRFIKIHKEKGPLSIEELNEGLPQEINAPQALDAFMHALEANSVVISELIEVSKEGEGAFLADPDKEEEEADEEEKAEAEDVKGNDPVRLYLRKMGSVSLLTREGEVEIARRIEKGEREIVRAILLSPLGTYEIIQLGQVMFQDRSTRGWIVRSM